MELMYWFKTHWTYFSITLRLLYADMSETLWAEINYSSIDPHIPLKLSYTILKTKVAFTRSALVNEDCMLVLTSQSASDLS